MFAEDFLYQTFLYVRGVDHQDVRLAYSPIVMLNNVMNI